MRPAALSAVCLSAALLLLATPALSGEILEVFLGSDSLQGTISSGTETDVFPFSAVANTSLSLTVKAGKGEALTPDVEVWGPDRTPVAGLAGAKKAKGGSVKLKKLVLPVTGRYYLLITGTGGTTGAYAVKAKPKAPKKVVLAGVIPDRGGSATFDLPSPGLATGKLTVAMDKKWSDADGPNDLEPNAGGLTTPLGTEVEPGEPKVGKGKFKIATLDLKQFGVYVFRVDAEPGTRGGFSVKASVKAGKREKRTILDTDILLPPTVGSITPTEAFVEELIEGVVVTGTFFQENAVVKFVRGSTERTFTPTETPTDGRAVVTVDVTQLAIGVWHIAVENGDGGRGLLEDAFAVKNVPVKNLAMTPTEGFDDEVIDVRITGEQLRGGLTVKLSRLGEEINGTAVKVFSQLGYIDATFDLAGHSKGVWSLEVTNDGADRVTLPNAFTIKNAPPRILAFSPTSGLPGVVDAEILGTQFDDGATARMTRAGEASIHATNLTVVTENKITCTFDLTGAAAGFWGVRVDNPDGALATKDDVYYLLGPIGPTQKTELDDPAIGPPDVVLNLTDEELFMVWAEKSTAGDYTVRGQRYSLATWAAVGDQVEIKTGHANEDAKDKRATPSVAWSPDHNRYCVAWVESLPDGNGFDHDQIWARILTSTGSNYSAAVQVTDDTVGNISVLEEQTNGSPDVVYDTDAQEFQIVFEHDWDDESGTDWTHDWDVMSRIVSPAGVLDGSLGHYGSGFREDQPAMDWNEELLSPIAVWRYGDTGSSMSGTEIEIGDIGGSTKVKLGTTGTDTDPAVAWATATQMLVVWVRDDDTIVGQLIDPGDLSSIGSEITFGGTAGEKVSAPRTVYNPKAKEYLVLWSREASGKYSVQARRYGENESGQMALLGAAGEVSAGTDKEVYGVPIWLPKLNVDDSEEEFDLFVNTWFGDTTKSGADFLSNELLFRRWK